MNIETYTQFSSLRRLFLGYRVSQSLYVAAKLGIADLLSDRPKSVDELAQATGADAPSLYRVLRLLASERVFIEQESGHFALTPLALPLQSNAPVSLRARVIFDSEPGNWLAWGNLLHGVMTGERAFDDTHGLGLFEYFQQNPGAAESFNELMVAQTLPWARAVVEAYDFSGMRTLMDVGGGLGALLETIMAAYPSLHGILFDLPHVIASARPWLEAVGVQERCETVAGNFFEAVPDGADGYLLKHILHDWNDEQCIVILRNCRKAMGARGRLLVVEMLVAPGNEPSFAKYMDVNMLVLASGRERTEAEYEALFRATGFALARIVPTGTEVNIIEGVPV